MSGDLKSNKEISFENINIFQKILNLEIAKNFDNKSVVGGGLDDYMETNAHYLVELIRNYEDKYGKKPIYDKLDHDNRQLLCNRLVDEINLLITTDDVSVKKSTKSRSKIITKTLTLDSDLKSIGRVPSKIINMFSNIQIKNLYDLLTFFPRRHRDFNDMKKVNELIVGETQTVVLTVWEAKTIRYRNGVNATVGILGDETGNVKVQWFGRGWLVKQLKPNVKVIISGKVNIFRGNILFSGNFEYEIIDPEISSDFTHVGRFVPVYPLTGQVHQRSIRQIVKKTLDLVGDQINDFMPESIITKLKLMNFKDAVKQFHYPDDLNSYIQARKRIVFDEFFLHQSAWLIKKKEHKASEKSYKIRISWDFIDNFFQSLTFQPTKSQIGIIREIIKDLDKSEPMTRLLQGEVGSGKTLVAIVSALSVIDKSYKSAIMAPTEILAEQHYMKTLDLFRKTIKLSEYHSSFNIEGTEKNITLGLFLGSMADKDKFQMIDMISKGHIDMIIGTHTLIQGNVHIPKLALNIIDEQHRFGVLQRASIKSKENIYPHTLTMSATPIPRSLALTVYGDLDLSELNELPFGERKVKTKFIKSNRIKSGYNHIQKQIEEGRQAIIVCPLIEESEKLNSDSAEKVYRQLKTEIFPQFNIGLLHGRLKLNEKEKIMDNFRNGEINLLVSTTVIEVGVDIPNASVMLILSADRFGMSQLHQLRGRVGRGTDEGYCILVSDTDNEHTIERLKIFERINDGFELSVEDLRIRGEGDVMQTKQSGIPLFKVADLIKDREIQELSRSMAEEYIELNFDELIKNKTLSEKIFMIKDQMKGKLN